MPTLIIETRINAVPEICFDLIRRASAETSEQKIIGEFEKEQIVIFQSSFFGFKQSLTVEVIEFERPKMFVDEMTAGNFKEFRHVHEFNFQKDNETVLKDIFEWTSRFGIFGRMFDEVFLKKRLRKIVIRRNRRLKQIAENFTR
jgi:hypothetical protein